MSLSMGGLAQSLPGASSQDVGPTCAPGGRRHDPRRSPEDTVLAKLEWFRRGGETSERQWTDVTGLLSAGVDIDRRYLSEGAGELNVTDLLRRALDEVGQT